MRWLSVVCVSCGSWAGLAAPGWAQVDAAAPPVETVSQADLVPYAGRPVREVRLVRPEQGQRVALDPDTAQLVTNNLRTAPGELLDPATVAQDVRNLTRLNLFRSIAVEAEPVPDGGVIVTYELVRWPRATDVQVAGNRAISDQELLRQVLIRPGDPLDSFQIGRALERIRELYRDHGYYLAEVEVDADALVESNIVLFTIREGPRVRIRAIEFRGNEAFSDEELGSAIRSKTAIFILRVGQLDEEVLNEDVRSLEQYYRDRGYLDVRVDRQLDFSDDLKEAAVVFVVDEGPLYRMRRVDVEGATRFTEPQLAGLMRINPGDVYSQDKIRRSIQAVREAYERLGYVLSEGAVVADERRDPDDPLVDLVLIVRQEPEASFTGVVGVVGNELTKREVILRELELEGVEPGRPLDMVAVREAERRLRSNGLFVPASTEISVLQPDPDDPRYRDLLVQVEEANTGEISFGAAVNSDLGLFGMVGITQRNFDLSDVPESWSEFFAGRAFRGAGQTFSIAIQPGDEYSNLSVSLTEPSIFETDYSLRSSASYTARELESYDEARWGGQFRLGRRMGERWVVSGTARWQAVDLGDIDADAPVDVFEVEGENVVSGLGLEFTRTTVDDRFRPTRGTRLEFSVEQVGLLGGDFDFTRIQGSHSLFLTITEDFLGRRSVLSFDTRVAYQFGGETPIYERFFLGGRTFRAFDYRTISPKGIRNDTGRLGDDPVGGDWMFFWGTQYEFPIYDRFVGGVFFLDTGTVLDDPGLDAYRVSVGTGIRLYIPQLGQAPLAFDFAIPLLDEEDDDAQLFSFSVEVPF